MKLLERIANIAEEHGRLIERHYGEEKIRKVIEKLQVEANTQELLLLICLQIKGVLIGRYGTSSS